MIGTSASAAGARKLCEAAFGIPSGKFVAQQLAALGITDFISVPGSQILPVWDALANAGIRLTVPRDERTAAYMAEGYGAACEFPAVLSCTLGVGVANELVALASAVASQSPVLALSPCPPLHKRERIEEVFQGLNSELFFRDVVKDHRVVDDETELGASLVAAMNSCLAQQQGPVRVDVAFPLLFRRSWQSVVRPRPPRRVQPGNVLVSAGQSKQPRDATAGSVQLSPGTKHGGVVPFALGALLACPQASVLAITTKDDVLANLSTFATAAAADIAVRVVGTADPTLRAVADAFGCRSIDTVVAEPATLSIAIE